MPFLRWWFSSSTVHYGRFHLYRSTIRPKIGEKEKKGVREDSKKNAESNQRSKKKTDDSFYVYKIVSLFEIIPICVDGCKLDTMDRGRGGGLCKLLKQTV